METYTIKVIQYKGVEIGRLHTAGVNISNKTAITILATQNKKLIKPMLAPLPQGSQILVTRAETTSTTRMMIACAVPLFCPTPIVTPKTILVAKNKLAKSCDP
jgi:hypothetical protein